MIKLEKNKSKGLVIWLIGLPGSGKTSIANKIKKKFSRDFGPTIVMSGDDLRKIYGLKKYSKEERIKLGKNHSKFCKSISDQGINIIFAAISLFDEIRKFNRKNIKNYVEVYVKSKISRIKQIRKKNLYFKNKKDLMGIDIKPEFPKNSHITINNNFRRNLEVISEELLLKLKKLSLLK